MNQFELNPQKDILAFAINCITTNDIVEDDRDELIKSVKVSTPIVQLYLFKYKVFTNTTLTESLLWMMTLKMKINLRT